MRALAALQLTALKSPCAANVPIAVDCRGTSDELISKQGGIHSACFRNVHFFLLSAALRWALCTNRPSRNPYSRVHLQRAK